MGWVASLVLVGDSVADHGQFRPGALDSLNCFFSFLTPGSCINV